MKNHGQNIAKSADRHDLLTAADVHKCANTINALNLLIIKLLNKKGELNNFYKNLFER